MIKIYFETMKKQYTTEEIITRLKTHETFVAIKMLLGDLIRYISVGNQEQNKIISSGITPQLLQQQFIEAWKETKQPLYFAPPALQMLLNNQNVIHK